MQRNEQQSPQSQEVNIPEHPIISHTLHRDTLDRVVYMIELLQQLDLSEGLTPTARAGLYWMHGMLAESVKYVSDALREPDTRPGEYAKED
jgi:hypothetical protein